MLPLLTTWLQRWNDARNNLWCWSLDSCEAHGITIKSCRIKLETYVGRDIVLSSDLISHTCAQCQLWMQHVVRNAIIAYKIGKHIWTHLDNHTYLSRNQLHILPRMDHLLQRKWLIRHIVARLFRMDKDSRGLWSHWRYSGQKGLTVSLGCLSRWSAFWKRVLEGYFVNQSSSLSDKQAHYAMPLTNTMYKDHAPMGHNGVCAWRLDRAGR
jgi:hypothetical protein